MTCLGSQTKGARSLVEGETALNIE